MLKRLLFRKIPEAEIQQWHQRIKAKLGLMRLELHPPQVVPTATGFPWLGFVVSAGCIRVKSRKQIAACRRLRHTRSLCLQQKLPWQAFAIQLQAWFAHIALTKSANLRAHTIAHAQRDK